MILHKLSKGDLSVVCAAILAISFIGVLCTAAQDSPDPAHSYCVKSGYLYHTSPGMNAGQGVCVFPNNNWCDAQAFYSGSCGPSLSPSIFPGYSDQTGTMGTISAEELCRRSRGSLKSVHTPYGDISICVLPDGTNCDMKSLSEGRCGITDYWMIYARSWLNAP